DQKRAELASGGRADLLTELVQELADRPFEELQRDVASEAVGHDDVRCATKEFARLGIAAEVDGARREQLVGLQRELVSLLGLLADREQADGRSSDVEDLAREDRAHVRELDE